ncbi:MAG TPA: DUF2079 domain-containing protein [Polyangiaceae bacterium]|nr:DUF2079 domain-containing protein [Polyangiaceae bacterium]
MQAVAIFAGVGASIGLFSAFVGLPRVLLAQFLDANALTPPLRMAMTIWLFAGAGLGGLFALLWLALRGRAGVASLRRTADVIFPLALAFLVPSLFVARPWHGKPMVYLVLLAATTVALEWTLRRALAAWPASAGTWVERLRPRSTLARRVIPLCVVLLGSIAYATYFSYYTILNHQRLGTAGFDLGINVNWCYNALNGQLWRSTVLFGEPGGNFISGHAIFAMLGYLPLFALKPDAEFFLLFQAVTVGFAGTTLYLFASTQLPRWSAVVVAYAFLMFAPLHGPNFYDYHELLPPLLFHFLLYWAIATNRNWLVVLNVLILWSFREDIPIGTCMLGLFLLLTGLRPRLGLVLASSSLVWFAIIKFLIMPLTGSWWFASIYKDLQPAGTNGYGPVLQTILINQPYLLKTLLTEEKLVYFLHMMGPLALLPLRRMALLLLAIPGFAFSLLTTGYPPTLSIAFQYTCHAIPYIFAASVLMLRVLTRGDAGTLRRRAALGAVAFAVTSHSYVFGAVLQHETFVGGFGKIEFTMTSAERQRYQTVVRMNARIPREASVAASENLVPHVAARINVYTLKDGVPADADYVFLHGPSVRIDASRTALNRMFERDDYGLLAQGDELYLFKRGHSSPETKAALSSLNIINRSKR